MRSVTCRSRCSFTSGGAALERRAAQRAQAPGGGRPRHDAVMTYAVSLYAGAMQGIAPDLEQLLRFVSLWSQRRWCCMRRSRSSSPPGAACARGTLVMDVPVALSIGAAYLWSVWSTLRGQGAVYFDSAVMFTFFLLLGRYLEMSLRHRSGLQHDALRGCCRTACCASAGADAERVTPDELSGGDRVRVLPGERIPADGEIQSGSTEIDESLLTGESVPQLRRAAMSSSPAR